MHESLYWKLIEDRAIVAFSSTANSVHTMTSWFIAVFPFFFVAYSVNGVRSSNKTVVKVQHGTTDGETVVCNQFIGQDASASEAIKKLDEKLSKKLDELIKLMGGKPTISPG